MRALPTRMQDLIRSGEYAVHARVRIEDPDGSVVVVGYGDADRGAWLVSVEYGEDLDQPVSDAVVRLRRAVEDLSLAPLMEDSVLNRDASGAYAPRVDVARRIVIETQVTAPWEEPSNTAWQNVFEGVIDRVEWSGPEVTLYCRDLGALLVDRWVEQETTYGDPENGEPLEDVAQAILDDWAPGVTLYAPDSPGFMVTQYRVGEQSVMDALEKLAQKIGWAIRYRYDSGSGTWRLTLYEPDRSATTPQWTFGPDDYLDVTTLEIDRDLIRNVVEVEYLDSVSGKRETVVAEDPVSIARYGRRWMKIIEADDSPINTEAEAQAMADAAVADTAWPEAEQQIETLYFPAAEIGDLYRFTANGVHYDRNHDWAVASVRHSLALDRQRTTIRTRGKPAGMYRQWFRASSLSPGVVLYAECQARIVSSTATTVTVEVLSVPPYGTVELVSVVGATLASGPAPGTPSPSGTQWTFSRPAFQAGEGQAVFRASAFGHQSDDDHIVIPEQGRDTVALVMRAQVVSVTASQIAVRVYVADPQPGTGNVTVTAAAAGGSGTSVTPASGTIPAAQVTSDLSTTGYVQFTLDRPSAGAGTGRVTFTATRAGRVSDVDAVDVPEQTPTVYRSTECIARIISSTATQVTVQVTATAEGGGTPQVELVGVTGATLASGASPGTKVASGSTWTFNRPAFQAGAGQAQFRATLAGATSDDDLVVIPEQGRDTVPLLMRARVLSVTGTQIVVRVAVADPFPGSAITITYSATGGTGLAVTPASPQTIPAGLVTANIDTTGFIDFTITRPMSGAGAGRVTFTASASGRVSDVDAVDVPELPPTAVQIPPRALIRILEYTDLLDAVVQITGVAGEPTASPPTEYRWREYREGDTPGNYSNWLPLDNNRQATVTVARRPKGNQIVEAQVRTASGLESDPVTVRVAPTDGWQDDTTGGPKWSFIIDDDGGQMALMNEAASKGQNLLGPDAGPMESTLTAFIERAVGLEEAGLEVGEIVSAGVEVQHQTPHVMSIEVLFLDSVGSTITSHEGNPITSVTWKRSIVQGLTIPAGTVTIVVRATNLLGGLGWARRFVLNRGPKTLPFEEPPFRPNRDTADVIQPGDSKALIHVAYVDQSGRPRLLYDDVRQVDVPVADIREPLGLRSPSISVVTVGTFDDITVSWDAHPDITSAWTVDIDVLRDGLRVTGENGVSATNEQAEYSIATGGSNRHYFAVLQLRNPNGAIIATYTTPVFVTP